MPAVSRKQAVLAALRPRRWTPGYALTAAEIGGSEGLRRVRELRAEGYDIKMRPIEGSAAFEYRLTSSTPVTA